MFGAELAFSEYYQSGHFSSFDTDFLRYMAFVPAQGPKWQISDLNFDRDYKRFGMTDALYAGNNPDLRLFKAHGGKLIVYRGWADAGAGGVPPLKTVSYYETAERTMGGPAATRDFFRLFMIPGMGHCGGGEGASNVDYVSYLENWVEKGRAPDVVMAAHNGPDGLKFRIITAVSSLVNGASRTRVPSACFTDLPLGRHGALPHKLNVRPDARASAACRCPRMPFRCLSGSQPPDCP